VVRIAQRYGADPNSALDVLQDTFMYLLKKFPPSGNGLQLTAKLSTLLYPVAKNLTLNQQRKSEPLALMDHEDLAVLAPQWQGVRHSYRHGKITIAYRVTATQKLR